MRMITSRLPWKLRIIVSLLISLVPFNAGRTILLRVINGYHISLSARIGFGTVLAVENADIGKATILRFNTFQGPFDLTIEDGSTIGPSNRFTCLLNAAKEDASGNITYPNRGCRIRKNSRITEGHYIDTTGGFELGSGSWIAGCNSQFWTHGVKNGSVVIGSECYVSSAVRFAPGSGTGQHVHVGLGSVVTKNFTDNNVMIGGVPAKVIKGLARTESLPQTHLRGSDDVSGSASAV